VEKREKLGGDRDRMESESLEFFEKVRGGYLDIARSESGRFRVIEVKGDEEAIFGEVKAAVEGMLRAAGD
jgi:dTMP kinase